MFSLIVILIPATAIEENAKGLAGISGERIWVETDKILSQPFAFEFIENVYKLGMDSPMGLPLVSLSGYFYIILNIITLEIRTGGSNSRNDPGD